MEATNASTRNGEARQQEGEHVIAELQRPSAVTTGLEVFDCLVCFKPLAPPIFQCAVGHLICSDCRDKLKDNKCLQCARPCSERCLGMERVVDSILVDCPHAKHGCAQQIAYYKKERHAKACAHARCFCPEPGCGFAAPAAVLLDHLKAVVDGGHNLPSKVFRFYEPFDLRAHPGLHVLHSKDEGHLFLLNVAPSPPLGHAVSLVAVQPDGAAERGLAAAGQNVVYSGFGCSVLFSCFPGHHQVATLDRVRCSSLADGPPADFFCVVPMVPEEGSDGATLRFTIDAELSYDDVEEMEEDDDDDSYYDDDDSYYDYGEDEE